MHTIYRTAMSVLLLTLVGCGSAPTRDAAPAPVATTPAPAVDIEPPAASPVPETAPMPKPAPVAAALEPMAPMQPLPLKPAPTAAASKPVAKPALPAKPAAVTKPTPAAAEPSPPAEVVADNISGILKLVAGTGQSVSAGEISEGLVYFLPKAGSPKPKPGRFKVNTRSKGFTPETLVVPQGSTVQFPNVDTIIHNVYSRSPGNSFDLGYYGPGKSPEYTFNSAGLAIVNCTVHHTMRANVVVLSTPYYTRPGKDGRYQIKGVPPGPGTLVFWHPRATAKSIQASASLTGAATQTLVASKSPQVH